MTRTAASQRRQAEIEAGREVRRTRLGDAIRDNRGEMPQIEMGEKLGGVPQTTISRWERGLGDMTLEQLWDIENAFQLPHGTLARQAGYVTDELDVVAAVETDPDLAMFPELREQAISQIRGLKKAARVHAARIADNGGKAAARTRR